MPFESPPLSLPPHILDTMYMYCTLFLFLPPPPLFFFLFFPVMHLKTEDRVRLPVFVSSHNRFALQDSSRLRLIRTVLYCLYFMFRYICDPDGLVVDL